MVGLFGQGFVGSSVFDPKPDCLEWLSHNFSRWWNVKGENSRVVEGCFSSVLPLIAARRRLKRLRIGWGILPHTTNVARRTMRRNLVTAHHLGKEVYVIIAF